MLDVRSFSPVPMTQHRTRWKSAEEEQAWRERDESWRQREDELEREKWRKRDEKAAETWRRVNEDKAARGEK